MKHYFSTLLFLVTCLVLWQLAERPVAAQNSCPAANFIDVQPHPENSEYPDPALTVTCRPITFRVESNGIPDFEFVPSTRNDLEAQDYGWNIPLTPSGSKESIPLLGTVAVVVNGIPIFGPNEAANIGFGDPYLDGILDYCNGHTGGAGNYHGHAPLSCVFDDYVDNVGLVVGYSFDGWPILAPYVCEDAECTSIVELESSWQLTDESILAAWDKHAYVPGSGDLDECNGMVQPDGSYAYYATATFPYYLGCYVNSDFELSVPLAVGQIDVSVDGGFSAETFLPIITSLLLIAAGVTVLYRKRLQ